MIASSVPNTSMQLADTYNTKLKIRDTMANKMCLYALVFVAVATGFTTGKGELKDRHINISRSVNCCQIIGTLDEKSIIFLRRRRGLQDQKILSFTMFYHCCKSSSENIFCLLSLSIRLKVICGDVKFRNKSLLAFVL